MQSIIQPGLFSTLGHAARMWSFHRQAKRKLDRWLAGGHIVIMHAMSMPEFPASEFMEAIVCGIDEMLITPRELRGLIDIETHPDFWKPDLGDAVRAGLEKDALENGTEADLNRHTEHFARYNSFARFDVYKTINGKTELTGGHRYDFFEPYILILRHAFSQPRTMIIENQRTDHHQRGTSCTLSLASTACGMEVGNPAIGFRFEYH